MAQTTKTDKKLPAQRREARLAAELRSNLRKRKQQARSRAQRADAADLGQERDKAGASQRPGEREGELA